MQRLMTNTLWNALGSTTFVAGRLVASIVLARMLGAEEFGNLAYLLWLAETISVFTGFGLQSTLTRFYAHVDGKGEKQLADRLARFLFFRFLLFTLLGLASFAAIGIGSRNHNYDVGQWIMVIIYYLFNGIALQYGAYLAGKQCFRLWARITLATSSLLIVAAILAAHFWRLTGAIAAYGMAASISAVMGLRFFLKPGSRERLPPRLVHDMTSYSVSAWLSAILAAIVWSRAEFFFLRTYGGPKDVAMFAVAVTFAQLVAQGSLMFCGALMPHFSSLIGAADSARVQTIFNSATRLLAVLIVPLSLGVALLVPVLLPAIYGQEFQRAVPATAVLVVAAGVFSVISPSSQLIYGLGKAWFHFVGNLPSAAALVVGCMVFVPRYGIWGAVLVRVAAQAIMIILITWYVAKLQRYRFPWQALALVFGFLLFGAIALTLAWHYVHSIWLLLTVYILGAIGYLVVLRIKGVITTYDMQLLSSLSRLALSRLYSRHRPSGS